MVANDTRSHSAKRVARWGHVIGTPPGRMEVVVELALSIMASKAATKRVRDMDALTL